MFNTNWFGGIQRGDEGRGRVNRRNTARIWAVGGGKGGIGKSFITGNLGISLSKLGKRVLLVDADLGAANLHTVIGVEKSGAPFSSFLKGELNEIEPLIARTSIPNLDIISGANDSLDVANLNGNSVSRLHNALSEVAYDYVLLDTSPGTSVRNMDIILFAAEWIIITTPDPTSVENTYRFLKCLMLRKIKKVMDSQRDGKLKGLIQQVLSNRNGQLPLTVADIFSNLRRLDREGGEVLDSAAKEVRVSILINQTKRLEDEAIAPSMVRACRDYFGIDVRHLGCLSYEESVGDSIRLRKPLFLHYSQSDAAKSLEGCLNSMLESERQRGQ